MADSPDIEQTFGRITAGIAARDNLVQRTIEFLRTSLPDWRDDPQRPDAEAEDILNAQLCKYLDARARQNFPMIRFDREERQVGRRQVDLAASPAEPFPLVARTYSIYDPILIVECKRLPTPSNDREKEYASGGTRRSGGIQRFKLGLYASGDTEAVIVGYIQQQTAQFWRVQINRWISEFVESDPADGCTWSKADLLDILVNDTEKGIAVCS